MNDYFGTIPYPIANATYPVTLPVAELMLADLFECHSCLGYRFDSATAHRAEREGRREIVPCTVCGNAGAIMPGGVMHVDLAAGHAWEYGRPDLDLGSITVLARVRSPWRGRSGWYTEHVPEGTETGMPTGMKQGRAWGIHALARTAELAALDAARMAPIHVRSIRFTEPFAWPDGWPRSRRTMNAREALLAALDWPNGEARER